MRNKKLLAALLALCMSGGLAVSAEEPVGYVYYPTSTSGSTNIYTYNPDSQYEICTRVGYTTDLQLRPGETVEGIAAGNTTQWSVDTAEVAGVWHVYVKPLADGLTTNFLINTDQRTYRLIVTSGDTMEYSVRWAYPVEDEQDRPEPPREAYFCRPRKDKDGQPAGGYLKNTLWSQSHNRGWVLRARLFWCRLVNGALEQEGFEDRLGLDTYGGLYPVRHTDHFGMFVPRPLTVES